MALLSLVHANIRGVLGQEGREGERERGREERKRGKGEEERRQADTVPDTVVCKQLHQLSVNSCTSCL